MRVRSRVRRLARRVRGGPVEVRRATTLPPVFVGGTGRSGTTITARILGMHPSLVTFPREAKFVSAKGGLCDLAAGRTGMGAFRRRMLGDWAERATTQGAAGIVDRALVEAALDQLDEDCAIDPWAAGAAFTYRLFDPLAVAAGAAGWIEMTPSNALAARDILRMFPDMRLIHSMRDGRDVACSIVGRTWGPNDPASALDYWAQRLRLALEATRDIPPGQVLTVRMEALIAHDRDGEYRRLLAFLDLEDDPGMRAFFDEMVTPERAHLGRWRSDIGPEQLPGFESRYERLAAEIEASGAGRTTVVMQGADRPGVGAAKEGAS